jgi:pentose-5-phosphate-3-epimerase
MGHIQRNNTYHGQIFIQIDIVDNEYSQVITFSISPVNPVNEISHFYLAY